MVGGCIFIVGYMGAGKSTGGRRLAQAMNLPFMDTDAAIVEDTGMDIPALFDALGEAGFRAAERRVIERVVRGGKRLVVATGGGTPCHGDNMAFMRQHGKVVYFKVGLDALLARLQARRKERPLIADIPDAELKGFIREHLAGREQFYTQAHITVDADALDGERMASVIHMIESGRVNP